MGACVREKDLEQYRQDVDGLGTIWVYIHLEFSLLLVGIDDVIPLQGRHGERCFGEQSENKCIPT